MRTILLAAGLTALIGCSSLELGNDKWTPYNIHTGEDCVGDPVTSHPQLPECEFPVNYTQWGTEEVDIQCTENASHWNITYVLEDEPCGELFFAGAGTNTNSETFLIFQVEDTWFVRVSVPYEDGNRETLDWGVLNYQIEDPFEGDSGF